MGLIDCDQLFISIYYIQIQKQAILVKYQFAKLMQFHALGSIGFY
jgi:hypothetical protein